MSAKQPAPAVRTVTPQQRARRESLVAYSFIAPNFIGFAVFTLVPMVMAVVLAFLKWDGSWANPIEFVGLKNFTACSGTRNSGRRCGTPLCMPFSPCR